MAPVGPLEAGSSLGGSVFRANLRTPPRFGCPEAAGLAASVGLAASAGLAASVGFASAWAGAWVGAAGACAPQAARRPPATRPPARIPHRRMNARLGRQTLLVAPVEISLSMIGLHLGPGHARRPQPSQERHGPAASGRHHLPAPGGPS